MRWVPLESNPEVMTAWSESLGLDTSKAAYNDVFGVDDELLAMVPQPVYALLLLFPVSDAYNAHSKTLQEAGPSKIPDINEMIYFKQFIRNACGTVGLVHALANSKAPLKPDSVLEKLFEKAKNMSPYERGKLLEEEKSIEHAHTATANMGQTETPDASIEVDRHFVALVPSPNDNHVIELDGSKEFPIDHGPIQVDFLHDAARVVRDEFMKIDKDSIQFNIIALTGIEE